MSEVVPGAGAKGGGGAPGEPPPSDPPPSSQRGFIGTNTDAAQAYVPPTALPETPEPPAPRTKVALADAVDPRKAPTHPGMKKAAQALAAELQSERPPPMTDAAPDSSSGVRRGSGYAPTRSGFPPPITPIREGSTRSASVRPQAKPRSRPAPPLSPSADSQETPAQKRAALALTFLFAALFAVAVYFFLRKAPSPQAGPGTAAVALTASQAPSARPGTAASSSGSQAASSSSPGEPGGAASAASSSEPASSASPASAPSPASTPVSGSGATPASAPAASADSPAAASSSAGSAAQPAASTPPAPSAASAPSAPSGTPASSPPASATGATAPSDPAKPKSDRWF